VTSMVSLKQAKYVREDYDRRQGLYLLPAYAHPRLFRMFYKGLQQDPGIFMTKGP
jgi:quinone-modifying oxidoreductase subunit QmoB